MVCIHTTFVFVFVFMFVLIFVIVFIIPLMVVVIDYWSTLVCIHTTFAKLAETRPRGQKRPTVYLLFNFFSGLQKKLHVGVHLCIIWNIMQVSENLKKKKKIILYLDSDYLMFTTITYTQHKNIT